MVTIMYNIIMLITMMSFYVMSGVLFS